jgi:hypothetical protein
MKSKLLDKSGRMINKPGEAAIRRAVASSTAIETGESIELIEHKLRNRCCKYRDLPLAEAEKTTDQFKANSTNLVMGE